MLVLFAFITSLLLPVLGLQEQTNKIIRKVGKRKRILK
jgi:hypothetical protein